MKILGEAQVLMSAESIGTEELGNMSVDIGVPIHPAANLFPMIEGKAFDELVEDIRENGLKESVVFYNGQLLDGRNRYRACQALGIEPAATEIDDDEGFDPVAWVLSMNLHRRHLSETQREAIAAKVANLNRGDNQHTKEGPQFCGSISVADAAEQLNVKPRSVESAKSALKGGCKALTEMLEAGKIPSSTAEKFVRAVPDKREQDRIIKCGPASSNGDVVYRAGGLPAIRKAIKEKNECTSPIEATNEAQQKCDDVKPVKSDDASAIEQSKSVDDNVKPVALLVGIRRNLNELNFSQLQSIREHIDYLMEQKKPLEEVGV